MILFALQASLKGAFLHSTHHTCPAWRWSTHTSFPISLPYSFSLCLLVPRHLSFPNILLYHLTEITFPIKSLLQTATVKCHSPPLQDNNSYGFTPILPCLQSTDFYKFSSSITSSWLRFPPYIIDCTLSTTGRLTCRCASILSLPPPWTFLSNYQN